MKKINQNGFGIVEILLIIVFIALVAGVGWYVWSKNNQPVNDQATTKSKVPKSNVTYGSVDAEGIYIQKDNKFKLQLPGGWKFVDTNLAQDRIWAYCIADTKQTANCPAEQNKAAILEPEPNPSPTYTYGLDIWYQDKNEVTQVKNAGFGKPAGGVLGKNITGNRYIYESDGIKEFGNVTPKGSKRYSYEFGMAEGRILLISYSVTPDYPIDHVPTIEKMIQTLEVF